MGCELPRVNKCCCCPLRTGALIIGYYSLISAGFSLASTSTLIYQVAQYVAQNQDHPPPGLTSADVKSKAVRQYIALGLQLAGYLFYFTISLLLVIGAHKNKPRYMRHYFIVGIVNLVFNLAVVIVSFLFTGLLVTLWQLSACGLMFYFLLVIRSTALEMEEAARPKVYEMTETGPRSPSYVPTPPQYAPAQEPLMQ
ncbi:uncharacterized protein LOC105386862 isoform X2 [Plutella xylostella]|uniref:uncharacterized protein LOC105386862 isoform X1 n=1 Tax=Plutella xylostella TaxID=51655 RepID=UPI002032B4B8|nr:uncharacterized protein LOC105386862 isoform X1 [Plutella xylostella]XP_037970105.2 uncharacterized protein LOC105386862 isoform X2 [Plutella xylostella]